MPAEDVTAFEWLVRKFSLPVNPLLIEFQHSSPRKDKMAQIFLGS